MASESKTAVVAALVGNAALVMLEGAIAATTGSAAMLAETVHSLADTGNQMLLFVGMRLAGAFVFEAMSLGVALHSVAGERRGVPRLRFMRETRDPTLPTVLLEDSAALLSILVAAAGLGLARVTEEPRWDAAASAVIGLILIAVASFLAYENYSLLLGEPATADHENAIRARLAADPTVREVVSLSTMHLGPSALLISARVAFRPELTTLQIEDAVRRLEDAIRAVVPGTRRRMIVIEPARPDAAPRAA